MTLNEKESLENSFDELNSSHNSLKNKLNECNQSMSAMRERYVILNNQLNKNN